MSEKSFEARFCRERGLSPDRYEQTVLKHALYPHARWLYGLIRLVSPDHFVADLDLVRNVAKLTRLRDFNTEVQEFVHHPANTGAARRTFNLRVSTKRLRRLVKAALHGDSKLTAEEINSLPPFSVNMGELENSSDNKRTLLQA